MRPLFLAFASLIAALLLSALYASSSFAQAINIVLGQPGTAPSSAYAAAGLPGVWNDIGLTAFGQHVPLVGLDGVPIAADLRQIGATAVHSSNDPATSGDDEALLDSMVTSLCNPLDACYWIDNLQNGPYLVTLYALTPNNAALLSSVRVDDATPSATLVGGAWEGTHIEGLSYQSFLVEVVDTEIGLHSGVPGGDEISGLNGIQIQPATQVGVGSIGETPIVPPDGARLFAFPNPASGAQTIEVLWGAAFAASGAAGPFTLEIVDVLGRTVWSERVAAAGGSARFSWDGRSLGAAESIVAPGVYFARLAAQDAAELGASAPLKLIRSR